MRLPTSAATEHEELIREMALIEKLSTQERLKLARKRRKEQLRRFFVRDRDGGGGVMGSRRLWRSATSVEAHSASAASSEGAGCGGRRSIRFPDAVVLLEAAARNDVEEVGRLLSSGVNPDSTNEDGLTALHQCCIDDSVEMMTLLMDHGADVDAEDSERWTPLHAAATCGHLHLVSQLVNRGANLLSVNADGNMPYDICEEETTLEYIETQMARRGVTQELIERTRGHMEAAMLADLKSRPVDRLDERIGQHATPLHVAAANGYMSVLSYLLEQHVQVDARDSDDWQAVHAAACWGHLPVIELLCQNGADLLAKTRGGETPLDVCEDSEIRDRLDQLRCEQEVQRRAAAAADDGQRPRGVRRSQSTKHSIRRTSMRDKTLTPKKDVKQETQMRQSMDVTGDGGGLTGDVTLVDDIRVQLTPSSSGIDGDSPRPVDVDAPSVNRALADRTPKEQRNGASLKSRSDLQQTNNNHDVTSHVHESATAACVASAALDDPAGKIDIHVHVTVNASSAGVPPPHRDPAPHGNGDPPPSYATAASLGGTLADLKRQRALLRSAEFSGGSVCLTPFSPSLIIDGTATPSSTAAPSAAQLDRSPRGGAGFVQNSSSSVAEPRRRFLSSDSGAADAATGVGKRAPHVRKPNSGCCRMQ